MTRETDSCLTLKLFGVFEARLNGELIPDLQFREGERLLALLVLNQGFVLQGPVLASTLWPETESLDSLRASVVHLRNVLGAESSRLNNPRGGLAITLEGADVDVLTFDRAIKRGD